MALAKQDLDKLLNQATIKLVGASNAGLKAELYDVLTEFFDISSSWQERLYLNGLAGVRVYDIVPSEGQVIRLGGTVGSTLYPTVAAFQAAGSPEDDSWFFLPASIPDFDELVLAQTPNKPQLLRVTVIKNVVLPTTRDLTPIAPYWVLTKYGRYILDGVLGKMMGQSNKSYSNDALSVYHLKRFQEGISRARTATLNKNTYGMQAWSFPGSFKTRSQSRYLSTGTSRGF
jgi:hypothetical protein